MRDPVGCLCVRHGTQRLSLPLGPTFVACDPELGDGFRAVLKPE
jgi:hypothetical protein